MKGKPSWSGDLKNKLPEGGQVVSNQDSTPAPGVGRGAAPGPRVPSLRAGRCGMTACFDCGRSAEQVDERWRPRCWCVGFADELAGADL
jgi:hypothetical protein